MAGNGNGNGTAERRILVWDLDLTLGEFDSLSRLHDVDREVTVRLRPGIGDALGRLADAGFVHVVLTAASPPYAELALRATGLRDRFAEVSGRGQRFKGDVLGIASAHGVPQERVGDRVLFVGDQPLIDAPTHKGTVFHFEPRALSRSAGEFEALVHRLLDQGDGSLYRGFESLLMGADAHPIGGEPAWRVRADGLPDLLLAHTDEGVPVSVFEHPPAEPREAEMVRFIPAEFLSELPALG